MHGLQPFPVDAGNGLIFHTAAPQLNLCPVDFKNNNYKTLSKALKQGGVRLMRFRCQALCSVGETWKDTEVLDRLEQSPFFVISFGAHQSGVEVQLPG